MKMSKIGTGICWLMVVLTAAITTFVVLFVTISKSTMWLREAFSESGMSILIATFIAAVAIWGSLAAAQIQHDRARRRKRERDEG